MNKGIKSFSKEELNNVLKEAKLPSFRAKQILSWLYTKNVTSYDDMTNIPKNMRAQLSELYPLFTPEIASLQSSVDGTKKYLLKYHDGAFAETVALPSADGRLTVCASSQSGCAMGCIFCATGMNGFTRDLEPGEIVDQILTVQEDFNQRVTNVVIMGQGEPFSNYDSTLAALRILNDEALVGIGARHITVSTCGIIDGINQFSREPEQFTLAISLHSAQQDVRDRIMPAMKNQKLGTLRKALKDYTDATGRRFSFEYALMKDINDGEEDLDALIKYCTRLLCHVNLIPLNNVDDSPISPVPTAQLHAWCDKLESAGIAASIRRSRGSDIAAACGQLASKA